MLPLDLSIQIIQVFNEFFFLGILAKHGRHLFFQTGYDVGMDFSQPGTFDEVVELKKKIKNNEFKSFLTLH